MAHFAKLSDSNIVENVIVISNDDCGGGEFPDSEVIGQAFIADFLGLDGRWVQTSYNSNFRGIYAGIGYEYDSSLDEFVRPPVQQY